MGDDFRHMQLSSPQTFSIRKPGLGGQKGDQGRNVRLHGRPGERLEASGGHTSVGKLCFMDLSFPNSFSLAFLRTWDMKTYSCSFHPWRGAVSPQLERSSSCEKHSEVPPGTKSAGTNL